MPGHDRPTTFHRRHRLLEYDYAQAGAYFITICTQDRGCCLGSVAGGVVLPSEAGEIVSNLWKDLPRRFPAVELDAFVVMPNHLHGILWLGGAKPDADSERVVPLGEVLRTFKALSARSVRTRPMPQFGWQRNYYEHVVRDEADLARIRQYIQDNPIRWDLDHENPAQLRRLR